MAIDQEPPAGPESWPIGHTLEQELQSEAFASRGWRRLVNATIYLSGLVDGRRTGIFATEHPETFTCLAGLASVVKATVQWFRLDPRSQPKFVLEAQKYLADSEPHNQPVPDPRDSAPPVFRSGPVVFAKGSRGTTWRRPAVAAFKDQIAQTLNSIAAEDLHSHQAAFRELAPDDLILAGRDILAMDMTHRFIHALISGFCADMLQEQVHVAGFERPSEAFSAAMADLPDDADLSVEPLQTRAERLEEVAERVISAGLEALGISVEKDFFRDRRGNVSR